MRSNKLRSLEANFMSTLIKYSMTDNPKIGKIMQWPEQEWFGRTY